MTGDAQCRLCGGPRDQARHGHLVCIGDGEITYEEENRLAQGQEDAAEQDGQDSPDRTGSETG